jgi:hypothetical protein
MNTEGLTTKVKVLAFVVFELAVGGLGPPIEPPR